MARKKSRSPVISCGLVLGSLTMTCCIGSVFVALFVDSPIDNANQLWEDCKRDEAIAIYAKKIENGSAWVDASVFNRVVEYHFQKGDIKQAAHFCNVAINNDVALSLSPPDLQKIYTQLKADHARKAEDRKAAELAEHEAEPKLPDSNVEIVAPAVDGIVRVIVWDDTENRPIHDKAEIWFRGHGSWWLKPHSSKFGGEVKELGRRPFGVKLTGDESIQFYPEGRDGREINVPLMMTNTEHPDGVADNIEIKISDNSVEITGLPIKSATGELTMKVPRR